MLLFRSDEELERWCERQGHPRGEVVPAARLERLARAWYGDRLDPEWRPRSVEESQAILAAAGLEGDFWRLA